ncbi:MAG: hypothetical protein GX945_13250 [Lentisphaerae bacterium]|nr:hypothetical protein [Lentisphaerota bacterium]
MITLKEALEIAVKEQKIQFSLGDKEIPLPRIHEASEYWLFNFQKEENGFLPGEGQQPSTKLMAEYIALAPDSSLISTRTPFPFSRRHDLAPPPSVLPPSPHAYEYRSVGVAAWC